MFIYDGKIFLIKLSKRISRYPHINVRIISSSLTQIQGI